MEKLGRALVLAHVAGVVPFRQTLPRLKAEEFQRRVEAAFRGLQAFGLAYDDANLGTVLIAEDRLVLVDLEAVWQPGTDMGYAFESYV
ncbi:Fc.00g034820.m01.CDS01 [Cosmosporella sp. VM-42]